MKPTTWIQSRWNRLRAAHRADMPALTVARARELTARHPECGPAWKLLGSALISLARYAEAEEAIRRATALCPVDRLWIPLAEMGHLHKARGDYEAAASWYRRAIDAAPDEAGGRIYLGGVLAHAFGWTAAFLGLAVPAALALGLAVRLVGQAPRLKAASISAHV